MIFDLSQFSFNLNDTYLALFCSLHEYFRDLHFLVSWCIELYILLACDVVFEMVLDFLLTRLPNGS